LWASNPRNGRKAVSGVARPQGVKGLGMAGPGETLRSPSPPLAIHPCSTNLILLSLSLTTLSVVELLAIIIGLQRYQSLDCSWDSDFEDVMEEENLEKLASHSNNVSNIVIRRQQKLSAKTGKIKKNKLVAIFKCSECVFESEKCDETLRHMAIRHNLTNSPMRIEPRDDDSATGQNSDGTSKQSQDVSESSFECALNQGKLTSGMNKLGNSLWLASLLATLRYAQKRHEP
jgi:hypothetical protein